MRPYLRVCRMSSTASTLLSTIRSNTPTEFSCLLDRPEIAVNALELSSAFISSNQWDFLIASSWNFEAFSLSMIDLFSDSFMIFIICWPKIALSFRLFENAFSRPSSVRARKVAFFQTLIQFWIVTKAFLWCDWIFLATKIERVSDFVRIQWFEDCNILKSIKSAQRQYRIPWVNLVQ